MKINSNLGYRGYIGSRIYHGIDFPQSVQNFLIRQYCEKHQLTYLLSATEYKIPHCFMILKEVIDSLDKIGGVVLFSIFMLPTLAKDRKQIYHKILSAGRTLHAALEDIAIQTEKDIPLVENILQLNKIITTDLQMKELQESFCI